MVRRRVSAVSNHVAPSSRAFILRDAADAAPQDEDQERADGKNDRRSVSLHPSLCRRQLLNRNDPDESRIENRSAQHRSIRRLHFNKVPGNARLRAMVRSRNRRHRERAQAEEMEPGEEGGLHSGRLCSVEGTGLAPVTVSFNLHGRSIGLAQNRQRGSHGAPATCCCLIAQLNRNVVEAYT
jgi:hypothetical protein